MKKVLILTGYLLFGASVYAQTVIFNQDFNSFPSYTITGWNTATYSGVVPWRAGELYLVNGTCFGGPDHEKVAGICDCISGQQGFPKNNKDVFMYTPAINLAGVTGAWLSFDSYFKWFTQNGVYERATVEISTNSGGTWTVLKNISKNASIKVAETYYIDLSAYSNLSDVRIGFRYSDNGLEGGGWAVDNVKLFVPAHKDLALIATTPADSLHRYVEIGKGLKHGGIVYNAGLDTVFSFIVHYRQAGGNLISDTISNIAIPAFAKLDFISKIPDTITYSGNAEVNMWVELNGDSYHQNDSMKTDIRGTYFIPRKSLVIEEGTGTWNKYCPQGWVLMNQVPASDADACEISVHGGDPMEYTVYDDYIFNLNWYYSPYFLFDRRLNAPPDSFFYYLNDQKTFFGFADVSFDWLVYDNSLFVNAHIKPAIDLRGDFRLALVVTEDGVSGTDNKYAQANAYANNALGPMGGFENKPDPVPASDMQYNFVVRAVGPTPEGEAGQLPAVLTHNTIYDKEVKAKIDPAWKFGKMRVIVMLIRHDDSTILNASKSLFYLNVSNTNNETIDAVVYPNPAADYSIVKFSLAGEEKVNCLVTDITGRTVFQRTSEYSRGTNQIVLPANEFVNGFYLVNLSSPSGRKSLKLQVLH
jgi:hypothetical protein